MPASRCEGRGHGRRAGGAVHLHAGGDRRTRHHRARAGDLAYAVDVRFQLHPRHRADRGDGGAGQGDHAAGAGHRLPRGAARCGQCRRRLCGDRAHAGHVQVQQEGGRQVSPELLQHLIELSYFIAATLLLIGLQRMASPKTARSGIQWAGIGVLVAVIATFFLPDMHNIPLMIAAIVIGVAGNWVWGKKVAITDMPQMVALFNGMGGGSAAAIGAVELWKAIPMATRPSAVHIVLAVVGALIGAVSLTGSIIAWAKLDGRMDKRYTFPGQQYFNALVFLIALAAGAVAIWGLTAGGLGAQQTTQFGVLGFFGLALLLGILMTLPIGGADMPVVISLYNAFTGLAVAFEGYVLGNQALIIAGMMVGAAGMLLTRLMAKAMNRSIK
ncbi:MAG: NAD(P)(+) transhydrogenase (Re/Si-specific) subunit beta, partial [Proteobacteria bacterium]|nr:NAD(P)(+) transhydrogenase (Re/Si-specific) subunit beta [Pseudomonadota bacterium]